MRFMILLVEKSHLIEVPNLTGTPFSWAAKGSENQGCYSDSTRASGRGLSSNMFFFDLDG